MVGPNASFLRYIRDVLPALGEIEATQTTIEELVTATPGCSRARRPGRGRRAGRHAQGRRPDGGGARAGAVVAAADAQEGLVVPRGAAGGGSRRYEAAEVVDRAARPRRPLRRRPRDAAAVAGAPGPGEDGAGRRLPRRPGAGRGGPQHAGQGVRRRALAGGRPGPAGVAAALGPRASLAAAADGVLDEDEQALLRWDEPAKAPGSARWSLADAVLLDEAADLVERTPSVAHIVVDEAQDLSPMMLRALARRCATGSLTVLGDLAQATTPWARALVGRGAGPPGQARRPRRGADPRLPGAGRGDRVRRPPAPRHRPRAGAADLGAAQPRRADLLRRRPLGRGRERGRRRARARSA